MKLSRLSIIALFLVPFSVIAQRQVAIRGRVIDDRDGKPLPGSVALIKGSERGAVTDPTGVFVISNIGSGTYTIAIMTAGFERIEERVEATADTGAITTYRLHYEGGPTAEDAAADLEKGVTQIYFHWPGTIPQESLDSLTQAYGFCYKQESNPYPNYAGGYNQAVWKHLAEIHGKEWPGQRALIEQKLWGLKLKYIGPKGLKPAFPGKKGK